MRDESNFQKYLTTFMYGKGRNKHLTMTLHRYPPNFIDEFLNMMYNVTQFLSDL